MSGIDLHAVLAAIVRIEEALEDGDAAYAAAIAAELELDLVGNLQLGDAA